MKMIVVYHSKTGFSKHYAHWISEELDCRAISDKEFQRAKSEAWDLVIFGGGLMAGKINGLNKIKKQAGAARLIVFATGATKMTEVETVESIRKSNFEAGENVPFFYFEGGINYEKMGMLSRKIMKAMSKSSVSTDQSDKDYIKPLIREALRDEKRNIIGGADGPTAIFIARETKE